MSEVPLRFRKSTPSQKCQLIVLLSNSKQQVDDFAGELTFFKCLGRT
jgi:hypothetical protein